MKVNDEAGSRRQINEEALFQFEVLIGPQGRIKFPLEHFLYAHKIALQSGPVRQQNSEEPGICRQMNFADKEFIFSDPKDFQNTKVMISEKIDAAYGLYVWPCAPVLAQFIWQNRLSLATKSVLEIGAGTALPGIVAAKCKANVILSDNIQFKNCLDLCKHNAELNGVSEVSVLGITWGLVTPTLMSLPQLDVVLASDCFYDSKDFEDVVMTLSYLLHWNPKAEVWCAYQVRSCDRSIEHLIANYNITADELPLPDMDCVKMSHTCHTHPVIQLFRLKLKEVKPS